MPVEEDKEEQVPPEELDPTKLMSIPFEILANKGGPTLHSRLSLQTYSSLATQV